MCSSDLGSALGDDEVEATKQVLGLDSTKTFDVAPEVIGHARKVVDRGREAHAAWQEQFDAWQRSNPDGAALLERMTTRTLPEGWTEQLPSWDADPKGVATRKASGEVLAALYPVIPSSGAGRRTSRRATTPRSRANRRSCPRAARPRCGPAGPTAAPCTSVSVSTPWARS